MMIAIKLWMITSKPPGPISTWARISLYNTTNKSNSKHSSNSNSNNKTVPNIVILTWLHQHIALLADASKPRFSPHFGQKCTSKGIWRQGIVSKHGNSLQKSLCPVVICPYLCSSDLGPPTFYRLGTSLCPRSRCPRRAGGAHIFWSSPPRQTWMCHALFTLLDLCVSSLRRGHAKLLCIVSILTDDPRMESVNVSCMNASLLPCDSRGGLKLIEPLEALHTSWLPLFNHSL